LLARLIYVIVLPRQDDLVSMVQRMIMLSLEARSLEREIRFKLKFYQNGTFLSEI